MAERLITTKITPSALRLIRLIAASTGEKQYEALLRVLQAEAKRIGLNNARELSPADLERADHGA